MIKCVQNKCSIDYGFVSWMNKIEDYFQTNFNIGLLDLPDENYMECYENGYKPTEMVQQMLETNDILFENSFK